MTRETFNYKGHDITFQLGNKEVMINATEMSRPFNKQPRDYLKSNSTKQFITALAKKTNVLLTDLVVVTKGGIDSGTWLHETLALDFAMWLNVDFKLWCNERIKELLTHGFTATPKTLEDLANNPDLIIQLATNLKKEREQKEILELEIETKHKPRSQFVDQLFNSNSLVTMSQACKILGLPFGRNTLFKSLRERGILFKSSNEPKQIYIDKGYFKVKEVSYPDKEGNLRIGLQTYVTQKGIAYLSTIYGVVDSPVNNKNKVKVISA